MGVIRLLLVLLLMLPVVIFCFYLFSKCVDYAVDDSKPSGKRRSTSSGRRAQPSGRATSQRTSQRTTDRYNNGYNNGYYNTDPYTEYMMRRGDRR